MAGVRPKCSWAEKETAALLRLAIDKKIFDKFDGKKVTYRQVDETRIATSLSFESL